VPSFARPIFIVGANRSGTTLLRLMLNAHSRIAVPEELGYFRSHYKDVPLTRWAAPNLSPDAYTALVRSFVERAAALHPELDPDRLCRCILDGSPADLRRPYEAVLAAWTRLNGKARWGEKTPGNLFYVDVIQAMFPDACFLYMVRDPRAGVTSMQGAEFFPDDVIFNAMIRRKHAEVGLHLLRTHVAPERWTTVRYEDLVARPEAELRRICAVVGEAYEPGMLQYHQTAAAYMKDEAAASFNAAATRPVTTDRVDRWRRVLSDREVALVETVCADEMARHDYRPERPRLRRRDRLVDALVLAAHAAYWKVQNWRHAEVRHYAVRHSLFSGLHRRLRALRNRLPDRWRPRSIPQG
jgi:hypothetical protein